MRPFRTLAVVGALLAFCIAILGSWIRINGAGMTCPDWPLCHGRVVPTLAGGVVLEWSHRAAALLETFVVLGTFVAGWRLRRRFAGAAGILTAIAALFVVQVLLGAATVRFANSPVSVVLHWAAGMGLLAAFGALAVLATAGAHRDAPTFGGPASMACAASAALAFVTMAIGAYVSSSGAGLACAGLPTCDGSLLGHSTAQLVQMLHRIAAGAFSLAAIFATLVAWQAGSRRAAGVATAGLLLATLQVALGAANIGYGMPTFLREMHAANAAATFVAFVIAAVLAGVDGACSRVRVGDERPRRVAQAAAP